MKVKRLWLVLCAAFIVIGTIYGSVGENLSNTDFVLTTEIDISDFQYALIKMCDFVATSMPDAEWHFAESTKQVKGKYLITTADNVRLVSDMETQKLCKVSVRLEYNNNGATLKEIALMSVIEGKLYDKYYISNDEKHRALRYAQDLMESSIHLYGDNISLLYEDENCDRALAAKGREVDYYWELIDDEFYVSVFFYE